jgi:predicted transcriptional regulator
MPHVNIDNIYSQIQLLSDTDKERLYQRMQKELRENSNIVAYTTAGQPLTEKQYIAKIEKAIEQAKRGELITDEELQKEIEMW